MNTEYFGSSEGVCFLPPPLPNCFFLNGSFNFIITLQPFDVLVIKCANEVRFEVVAGINKG